MKFQIVNPELGKRLTNLLEEKGFSQAAYAEKVGISQPALNQILQGGTDKPRKIKRMADVLGVSAAYLQYGDENFAIPKEKFLGIPVITWELAATSPSVSNLKLSGDTEMLYNYCNAGVNSFALTITTDQMNANPGVTASFVKGDKIIIDPDVKQVNGDFVLAKSKASQKAIFKQYFTENDKHYLKSLNPALSNVLENADEFEIIGVCVGSQWIRKI